MKGFLMGAMVGALAAIMVAPRRGDETRELVRTRLELWQDQVMARMDQSKTDLDSFRQEILGRLDEMRSQMPSSSEQMKVVTEGSSETGSR